MKRVFLIVLDSFGIGEMPDAAAYGDQGTSTIRSCATSPYFHMPNMQKLGLFNIESVDVGGKVLPIDTPLARIARMREASRGKDTTIGHWEIRYYFAKATADLSERISGRGVKAVPGADRTRCALQQTVFGNRSDQGIRR